MLNDALQTIGLLGGIAGAVLVAGPTPRQRAAGFATWIAGNGAWVAFAALTGSLYLGAQFGVFLLLSGVGLRTNLKELRVSKLALERQMNQKVLVNDLARLEEMTTDTNLLIHIARIRKRAENGFYHLQAGTIRNPVTGSEYPVMRRRIGRTDLVEKE
jgi:hypothetical protein